MKSLTVTTEPTIEPVTFAEAKSFCRIDTSENDDNALLTALIKAAREWCQVYTGRTFMATTYTLTLDCFPRGAIRLDNPPIQSVTHLKYYDITGTQQTWSSANYSVDTASEPGRLILAYNVVWPSIRNLENVVEVRYVAGYASAAVVPQSIKQAMLLLVGQMYEFREPEITGTIIAKVEFAVESLLNPFRIYEFV